MTPTEFVVFAVCAITLASVLYLSMVYAVVHILMSMNALYRVITLLVITIAGVSGCLWSLL